jgi:hypothetical protein
MSLFGNQPAKSDVFATISGEELTEIVREMGFAPELTVDSQGDPMVKFRIEGLRCQILFYGCKDGRANSIQFNSVFSSDAPLEKINDWNLKKRFGKASLDADHDVLFQMDVDLDGGVKRDYFEEIIKRWRSVFLSFARFLSE